MSIITVVYGKFHNLFSTCTWSSNFLETLVGSISRYLKSSNSNTTSIWLLFFPAPFMVAILVRMSNTVYSYLITTVVVIICRLYRNRNKRI